MPPHEPGLRRLDPTGWARAVRPWEPERVTALLLEMLAHVTGHQPGDFVHSIGDAHIYSNHMDQVALQLSRTPKPLPKLRFARQVPSIFDFRYEDFIIEGYDPDSAIAAPVAV